MAAHKAVHRAVGDAEAGGVTRCKGRRRSPHCILVFKTLMPWKILLLTGTVLLGGGAVYMLQGKQGTPKAKEPDFKIATAVATSIERTVRLTGQTSAKRYAT